MKELLPWWILHRERECLEIMGEQPAITCLERKEGKALFWGGDRYIK